MAIDYTIERALHEQALAEIRAAGTASDTENMFLRMWKSATHINNQYVSIRAQQTPMQLTNRQQAAAGAQRTRLVSLFTNVGVTKPTAEKIVDKHILIHR